MLRERANRKLKAKNTLLVMANFNTLVNNSKLGVRISQVEKFQNTSPMPGHKYQVASKRSGQNPSVGRSNNATK